MQVGCELPSVGELYELLLDCAAGLEEIDLAHGQVDVGDFGLDKCLSDRDALDFIGKTVDAHKAFLYLSRLGIGEFHYPSEVACLTQLRLVVVSELDALVFLIELRRTLDGMRDKRERAVGVRAERELCFHLEQYAAKVGFQREQLGRLAVVDHLVERAGFFEFIAGYAPFFLDGGPVYAVDIDRRLFYAG